MEKGGRIVSASSRLASLITDTLLGAGGAAEANSRGVLRLNFRAGPAVANLAGSWLELAADASVQFAPRELLERNRALPGLLKFALNGGGRPQLRAEVPLDEDAAALIRETRSALDGTLAALGGDQVLPFAETPAAPLSQDALRLLCEEAGWSSAPRSDGSCAVELETPGAFTPASVAADACGLRVFAPLPGCDAAAGESVHAIATLLLIAAGTVRMARPVFETKDGRVHPAFEVVFSTVPAAWLLAHALSALSVGCQFCAEEAGALRSADVARAFLAQNQTTNRKEPSP
jgi:hypothetical protein